MKVKVFSSPSEATFSLTINTFIADKRVIDIKFSVAPLSNEYPLPTEFAALVMYEDREGEDDERA